MKPIIAGHRGVAGHYPENTRCSILAAIDLGLTWIEVDIQPTKDNHLVVIHDHTIDRCSNGTGRVDSYTLEELRTFDFGSWFASEFTDETILTLEELLDITTAHNVGLNLEVKLDRILINQGVVKTVVTTLRNILARSAVDKTQILLSSFSEEVMKELADLCQNYRLGMISEKLTSDTVEQLQTIGAYSCHLNYKKTTGDDINLLHKAGYQVWCYTVNQPDDFPLLHRVDAIFSDDPQQFIE
ncbi:glycerophosphoryl diester phosphodiesterase [Vibrio albus]|uniref:Glycerophosphoryl diester phosphodiesterase n=1 Tax=Vibrio albus TaxID=2200953 RepID=A0A2U3B5U5_9VIBR|nr:glycerophosphodiester phosphodiesterase family protein [Vibrio albus]PWI32171.1 glycerophosphoryl diester phosphodiesterase [Vibrio albus]